MDLLYAIGDLWTRRHAAPDAQALEAVKHLMPATVITGASAGIGYALADRIAREDRCVILLARNWERLHAAAQDLQGLYPRARVLAFDYDVGQEDFSLVEAFLAENSLYLDVL